MSQININQSDKDWFDSFQESDQTQAEAFAEMVEIVKDHNGELVNPEEIAEQTADKMGPKIELSMKRVIEEVAR
jgi:hypothetical protein